MVAFASLQHQSTDQALELEVVNRLHAVDPVRFRHIAVSARQGVVVLFGTVSSYYAKAVSFQQARRVVGVNSVVDALQVVTPAAARAPLSVLVGETV